MQTKLRFKGSQDRHECWLDGVSGPQLPADFSPVELLQTSQSDWEALVHAVVAGPDSPGLVINSQRDCSRNLASTTAMISNQSGGARYPVHVKSDVMAALLEKTQGKATLLLLDGPPLPDLPYPRQQDISEDQYLYWYRWWALLDKQLVLFRAILKDFIAHPPTDCSCSEFLCRLKGLFKHLHLGTFPHGAPNGIEVLVVQTDPEYPAASSTLIAFRPGAYDMVKGLIAEGCNVHFVTHGKRLHAEASVLALDREKLLISCSDADTPRDLSRIRIVDQGTDKNVVAVFAESGAPNGLRLVTLFDKKKFGGLERMGSPLFMLLDDRRHVWAPADRPYLEQIIPFEAVPEIVLMEHRLDPAAHLYMDVPEDNIAARSLDAAPAFLHRAVFVSQHLTFLLKRYLALVEATAAVLGPDDSLAEAAAQIGFGPTVNSVLSTYSDWVENDCPSPEQWYDPLPEQQQQQPQLLPPQQQQQQQPHLLPPQLQHPGPRQPQQQQQLHLLPPQQQVLPPQLQHPGPRQQQQQQQLHLLPPQLSPQLQHPGPRLQQQQGQQQQGQQRQHQHQQQQPALSGRLPPQQQLHMLPPQLQHPGPWQQQQQGQQQQHYQQQQPPLPPPQQQQRSQQQAQQQQALLQGQQAVASLAPGQLGSPQPAAQHAAASIQKHLTASLKSKSVPGQQQQQGADRLRAVGSLAAAAAQTGSSAGLQQAAPSSPSKRAGSSAGAPSKYTKTGSSSQAPAAEAVGEVFSFVKQHAPAAIHAMLIKWLTGLDAARKAEVLGELQKLKTSSELRSFLQQHGIYERVGKHSGTILVHVTQVDSNPSRSSVAKSISSQLQRGNAREAAQAAIAADGTSIIVVPSEGDCNAQLREPFMLLVYIDTDEAQLSPGDHKLAAQGAALLSVLMAAPFDPPACCSGILELVTGELQQSAAAAAYRSA